MRSIVDTNGPVEVAGQSGWGESHKVDQIVHVLGQYNIKIAALQETKWFGSYVYKVAGAVVLTAGRSVPPSDEPVRRGEGLTLVLLNDAIASWQATGKQWRSWRARMISELERSLMIFYMLFHACLYMGF